MKVVTGVGGDLKRVAEQARRAEELGYDAVTTGETQHDSILVMTLAAEHTQRLEVCTSVTIAFPRSPMVLAMEAWDLQRFSNGRINIGLGSQVKGPHPAPLLLAVERAGAAHARLHQRHAGDLGLAGRTARRSSSSATATRTR